MPAAASDLVVFLSTRDLHDYASVDTRAQLTSRPNNHGNSHPTTITAEFVVAHPVIHALEGDVGGAVALILAVEARESQCQLEIVGSRAIGNCQRGVVGKVRAG